MSSIGGFYALLSVSLVAGAAVFTGLVVDAALNGGLDEAPVSSATVTATPTATALPDPELTELVVVDPLEGTGSSEDPVRLRYPDTTYLMLGRGDLDVGGFVSRPLGMGRTLGTLSNNTLRFTMPVAVTGVYAMVFPDNSFQVGQFSYRFQIFEADGMTLVPGGLNGSNVSSTGAIEYENTNVGLTDYCVYNFNTPLPANTEFTISVLPDVTASGLTTYGIFSAVYNGTMTLPPKVVA